MAENSTEERSGVQAFKDWVRQNHQQQPALGAELKALGREGLKDLQNAVLHAFPDSMRLTRRARQSTLPYTGNGHQGCRHGLRFPGSA